MILVKNSNFLYRLFLLKIGLVMMFGMFYLKKRPCLTIKNELHKVEKLDILERCYPMILVKNFNFLEYVFLLKIGQEMMFGNVLKRKEGLLHHKKICFISKKNGILSKGVNP